jgi:hypothetical protein
LHAARLKLARQLGDHAPALRPSGKKERPPERVFDAHEHARSYACVLHGTRPNVDRLSRTYVN